MISRFVMAGIVFVSITYFAVADDAKQYSPTLSIGTFAERLNTPKPTFPYSERVRGGEGWVTLSYVITPEGTVSDVVVQDVIGRDVFANAAVSAIKQWTFKPATWQGNPVEQCSNQITVSFDIAAANEGASRSKANAYREIREIIAAGDLITAQSKLDEMFEEDLNLYELAFFHIQAAHLAHMRGDYSKEAYYLRLASCRDRIVGRRTDRMILSKLFVSEVRAKHYADAFETFEELRKHSSSMEDWQDYEKLFAVILAMRDSNARIDTAGFISAPLADQAPSWSHRLLRRSIEFSNVTGRIGSFQLRCDRKYFSDEMSTERNWSVPEYWGDCTVFVFGEQGATFKLHELPADSPTVAPAPEAS